MLTFCLVFQLSLTLWLVAFAALDLVLADDGQVFGDEESVMADRKGPSVSSLLHCLRRCETRASGLQRNHCVRWCWRNDDLNDMSETDDESALDGRRRRWRSDIDDNEEFHMEPGRRSRVRCLRRCSWERSPSRRRRCKRRCRRSNDEDEDSDNDEESAMDANRWRWGDNDIGRMSETGDESAPMDDDEELQMEPGRRSGRRCLRRCSWERSPSRRRRCKRRCRRSNDDDEDSDNDEESQMEPSRSSRCRDRCKHMCKRICSREPWRHHRGEDSDNDDSSPTSRCRHNCKHVCKRVCSDHSWREENDEESA